MRIIRFGETSFEKLLSDLAARREQTFARFESEARSLIEDFKSRKEDALVAAAKDFDGVVLDKDQLWVDPDQIRNSHKVVSAELRAAIDHTIQRIERFQQELRPSGFQAQEEAGVYWGVEIRPLERVGIYVPRGYINALLLTAVPARLAKVEELVLATPPDRKLGAPFVDPAMLYAAKVFEIDRILVSGGVGALAAMAYGLAGSQAVEKIVGPTGQMGLVAKQLLSSRVAIDGLSGPMELVFLCDATSDLKSVASDVIGISERNPDAKVFVLHPQDAWLRKLVEEFIHQIEGLKEIQAREGIRRCLELNTQLISFDDVEEGYQFINELAPGLVVMPIDDAAEHLSKLRRCGGVLAGKYTSPVSLDLYGGAVGLVPTLGSAASVALSSPAAFVRRFSVIEIQKDAVKRLQAESLALAEAEGFSTHKAAYKARD